MAKEITTTKKNEMANAFFDDVAGTGFENTDNSDLVLSRIGILQDLSPQIKKQNEKYLPEAETGDFADLTLNKIVSKQGSNGFRFLPIIRTKTAIEWRPRTSGGGIESRTDITPTRQFSAIAAEMKAVKTEGKSEWLLPSGNELIETWQFFGFSINDDLAPCFIPIKKGGLAAGRLWYDAMRKLKTPSGKQATMFYSTWDMDSVIKTTPGGDYWNFVIKQGPLLQELDNWEEIAGMAVEFQKTYASGNFVADIEEDTVDADEQSM